jgi:hypothetical protein
MKNVPASVLPAPPDPSWRRLLDARPVRNAAARVDPEPNGGLRIRVRRQRPAWLVPPISWIVALRPERTLALDALGREAWEACDGQRRLEEIVDDFARAHALTFHEARVAVSNYLKQLVQRGALAVVYPDAA